MCAVTLATRTKFLGRGGITEHEVVLICRAEEPAGEPRNQRSRLKLTWRKKPGLEGYVVVGLTRVILIREKLLFPQRGQFDAQINFAACMWLPTVVISQTHWLVSRVRLARWHHLTSGGSIFTAGVSHHTPPPPGGAGLSQFFIF